MAAQCVVLGSGAAGLSAALAAAIAGARVTVLEAADAIGGTTAMSGGVAWVPGNPWAARAGVADSEEAGLEYLRRLDLGDVDADLEVAYVRRAVGVFEAVERHTPLRWQHMSFPDYHADLPGGHPEGRGIEILPVSLGPTAVQRVRVDPYRVPPSTLNEASVGQPGETELSDRVRTGTATRGCGLVASLAQALLEHGGEIRTSCRATRLRTGVNGVQGVEAGNETHRGNVVVATGGFERNEQLVRAFLRGPLVGPASPPTNRGDGLLMGMAVGARLGNMSEAWWAPAMHVEGETIDGAPFYRILFTDCAQPGGILVDSNGCRFVDEAANYSDFGRAFHRFDAGAYAFPSTTSWLIFDARRLGARAFVGDTVWTLAPGEPGNAPIADLAEELPWLIRAETIAALAEQIGVSPAHLGESVARFNEQAASKVDSDFGRGSFVYDRFSQGGAEVRPVSGPPFYALRVVPGALGTKGGLKTDADGRVLRADTGNAIPGLFAAGNAAASPFGCAYPGPGATIGPAIVFGWSAGQAAAAA